MSLKYDGGMNIPEAYKNVDFDDGMFQVGDMADHAGLLMGYIRCFEEKSRAREKCNSLLIKTLDDPIGTSALAASMKYFWEQKEGKNYQFPVYLNFLNIEYIFADYKKEKVNSLWQDAHDCQFLAIDYFHENSCVFRNEETYYVQKIVNLIKTRFNECKLTFVVTNNSYVFPEDISSKLKTLKGYMCPLQLY